jgi:hypothetical protein
MRYPSILDMVHAVKRAASSYPKVAAWWYAPASRLHPMAEHRPSEPPKPVVVIETTPGARIQHERIATCLARALEWPVVEVCDHRGAEERPCGALLAESGARTPVPIGAHVTEAH